MESSKKSEIVFDWIRIFASTAERPYFSVYFTNLELGSSGSFALISLSCSSVRFTCKISGSGK